MGVYISVCAGSILCDPLNPIEPTTKFRARIVIFNIEVPITQGFPVNRIQSSLFIVCGICNKNNAQGYSGIDIFNYAISSS